MDIIENSEGDGTSIRITLLGRMTFSDHIEMKRITRNAISKKNIKMLIDLEGLKFMDSAAIGMLLIVGKDLSEVGGEVVLVNPRGQVERVFAATRLGELITVVNRIGGQA